MRRLLGREDGIGVVTALMVSFIVFTLGATWYAISIHELDEVSFDRNRTQSIHAADAGAREAMYLLSTQDHTVRDAARGTGEHTSGTTSGACDLIAIQSIINGSSQVVGEYWYRITDATPADTEDHVYFIEAWGWGPSHASRQASVRKVELEVTVVLSEGFQYGLFAGGGGLSADNRKEIYGDIYASVDANIAQFTDLFDNGAFPGDGNLEVFGNLTIPSGSKLYMEGRLAANGYIFDDHAGDFFGGDVIAVEDGPGLDAPGNDAYFRDATINGVVRLGGTLKPGSDVNGAPVVENAVGLEPVPVRPLPVFAWDPTHYDASEPINTYSTWADFDTWYNANKTSLSGAHYVQDAAMSATWFVTNAQFEKDFILVVDGDLVVRGNAGLTGTATPPVTVLVAGVQTTSDISTGTQFFSSNDLRYLFYSEGTFAANQNTVIYGAAYAETDASSQKLTVHYRPPPRDLIAGFTFTDDAWTPEPGVWRDVPPLVDDTGVYDPVAGAYHCTLP